MLQQLVSTLEYYVWSFGVPVGGEEIPLVVIALLGTGIYLTLRLGFIQIRRLGHGFAVTTGKYDDPNEPGDVTHFQALTTALSATVGIGNIAGVAIAIHFGGPGALFWMWVTAALGMALKYAEVTLAQQYRQIEPPDPDSAHAWDGSVSGGPMYYIEKGLGSKWKPVAIFFSGMLIITSFLTGNAIQANTVADNLKSEFGVPMWISGMITATLVGLVILGGIKRIGRVTSILAPAMAVLYVFGALIILVLNLGAVPDAFVLIFKEAFNPTAGVAGTGVGAFLTTMMWGVRRGLFSNEAGQGSAPIAHAAAQTDEPVSEGVVALLEPFIDTIVICTMTGLVLITSGVWNARVPTELTLQRGDFSFVVAQGDNSYDSVAAPSGISIRNGYQPKDGSPILAWHEAPVERLFRDAEQTIPFTGTLYPARNLAVADDAVEFSVLYGDAAESGAPLTKLAFERGLSSIGSWGGYIVLLSVLLFGISTAISWSYYGDRCINYVFGRKAILPYKIVFVVMHFVGSITQLAVIWTIGDVALGLVILPNLIAVIMLSGVVKKMTDSYFERQPWRENEIAHKKWVEEKTSKR